MNRAYRRSKLKEQRRRNKEYKMFDDLLQRIYVTMEGVIHNG